MLIKVTQLRLKGEVVEGCRLLCPLSGQTVDDRRIEPHYLIATTCTRPTSIYFRCPYHMFQGFLNQPVLVARYLHAKNDAKPTPA